MAGVIIAGGALSVAASVKATNDAMQKLGGGGESSGTASGLGQSGGGSQAAATGFTRIPGANSQKQPETPPKTPPVKVFVVQKDIKDATERANKLQAKAVIK